MIVRAALIATATVLLAGAAIAQNTKAPRGMTMGWGVDTTVSPVREIVGTLSAYFTLADPGRTPTPLWNAREQQEWPLYDPAALVFYSSGARRTVVSVVPAAADSVQWRVTILYTVVGTGSAEVQTMGTQQLFLRHAATGWQLESALGVNTTGWPTRQVEMLVYHLEPGERFDSVRARTAAAFVRDAARRIGAEVPRRIDYYLTPSWDAAQRVIGVENAPMGAAFGGRNVPYDPIVIAGNPSRGEAFTHELAHVVVGQLGVPLTESRLASEGVATWLGGGNLGPTVATYYALLQRFLATHPAATFRETVSSFNNEPVFYATGALAADAVYRRGGAPALREFLGTADDEAALLTRLPSLLGINPDGLDAWWRRAAASAAR